MRRQLLDEPAKSQPVFETGRPGRQRRVRRRQADTVISALVKMHLRRHAGFSQGHIEHHAVLRGHAFVARRVKQKRGWGLGSHLGFVGETPDQLGIGVRSQQVPPRALMRVGRLKSDYGISQDEKVRPRARVEVGSGSRGQMPPAENPQMPTWSGWIRNSLACVRT